MLLFCNQQFHSVHSPGRQSMQIELRIANAIENRSPISAWKNSFGEFGNYKEISFSQRKIEIELNFQMNNVLVHCGDFRFSRSIFSISVQFSALTFSDLFFFLSFFSITLKLIASEMAVVAAEKKCVSIGAHNDIA